MDLYQVLSVLGVSGLLGVFYKYIMRRIADNEEKTKAVRLGVQALLRDRMIQAYRFWSEKGYAPIEEKDNFENMYKQYHSLGENGVMDEVHREFLKLPTEQE